LKRAKYIVVHIRPRRKRRGYTPPSAEKERWGFRLTNYTFSQFISNSTANRYTLTLRPVGTQGDSLRTYG